MARKMMIIVVFLLIPTKLLAWNTLWNRQEFLTSSISALLLPTAPADTRTRSVDVGAGVDLFSQPQLSYPDVVFPPSMEGVWNCRRTVMAIEGDSFMGKTAWKALGANSKTPFQINSIETYSTRFMPFPLDSSNYVVMDREYDTKFRSGTDKDVQWNVREPNGIAYITNDQFPYKIQWSVVRRQVKLPNDEGFGSEEYYRISDGPVVRAALVKRRFRRAYDEQNRRQIQGLEIIKTFRVLDGMAGSLPTATVKSSILMTRPQSDGETDVPSAAF